MGLGNKLDGKTLFAKARFPFGIDRTSQAWPHEMTTENGQQMAVKYIRFNWALTADEEPNKGYVRDITNFCVASGPSFYSPAATELSHLRRDDLVERIVTKYQYMRNEFNKIKKKEDAAEQQAEAALAAEREEEDEKNDRDAVYRSLMKSRVKAVSLT